MNESHDHSQIVLRRMLDANTNRVMEGLRTLEDVARFSGWVQWQVDYKSIRHVLQQLIDDLGQGSLGQSALVSARDAHGDVGRESKTTQEMQRPEGLLSIVVAAAINAAVPNVTATVSTDGYLTLSVKNSNAAPVGDKLQVAPGSVGSTFYNFLYSFCNTWRST